MNDTLLSFNEFYRNSNIMSSKIFIAHGFSDQAISFDDYEKLIKCDKVDVVYISLPNSFHKEWIDKCFFYKKKIFK